MSIKVRNENREFEEVYTKKEVDNIRTQSLIHIDDNVTILVTFKRSGNVVEVFAQSSINTGYTHNVLHNEFIGNFPEWAKPNISLMKTEKSSVGSKEISFKVIVNSAGGITCSVHNATDDTQKIDVQFTYIVDDSDTPYMLGDVDGNGVIDEVDLRMVEAYIMEYITLSDKQVLSADFNQDGKVTTGDYVKITNYIASQYQKGDINMDGQITQEDLDLLTAHLDETIELSSPQKRIADMNGDGELSSSDMLLLVQLINGNND